MSFRMTRVQRKVGYHKVSSNMIHLISPIPALNDALAAFKALKWTPEFFRRYLSRCLSYADQGASAPFADTQSNVFNGANVLNVWRQLLPADREL